MKKTVTALVYVVGGINIIIDFATLMGMVSVVGDDKVSGLTIFGLVVSLIFNIILMIGLISALNRTEDLEDDINLLINQKNNSKVSDLEYDFKDFKCEIKKEIEELKAEIKNNATKKTRKNS